MKVEGVRIVRVPFLIPNWAAGQAWPGTVLVKRGAAISRRFLAHELRHVDQWRERLYVGFAIQYLYQLARFGYWKHPLEVDARNAEADPYYLAWADRVLAALEA
jgi:hypothetical protein